MRRFLEKFGLIQGAKTKLLEDLNASKLFETTLEKRHASEELFRMKNKHRISEWTKSGFILDTTEVTPDSPEGSAFLENLNNDEIHKLATELNWDAPNAARWRMAFACHSMCDKATAWALFMLADAEYYERKIRENGGRPDFYGADAEAVELLDALFERFRADDFASNDLFYDKAERVGNHRLMQQQAENEGFPFEWSMPISAYQPSNGRRAHSAYELWHAEWFMHRFKDWVIANPEKEGAASAT